MELQPLTLIGGFLIGIGAGTPDLGPYRIGNVGISLIGAVLVCLHYELQLAGL